MRLLDTHATLDSKIQPKFLELITGYAALLLFFFK